MSNKVKKIHPKKELRDKLSIQLHMILAGFKDMVDEKKLHKLVKKAGKLLADGLHHKPAKPKPVKKAAPKAAAPKKVAVPAKPVKKSAKKVAKKNVKKATAKK